MKKFILFLLASVVLSQFSSPQVYMDLQDNMVIPSNSWVILNPGNFVIPDAGNDGLIQISDKQNIIIDGTGVTVDGSNYSGYVIKIDNSSYIEIDNFESVNHYFYAVYITNSDHININGNDFSYNKVDSTGWISVWTDYQAALGGGVMMYQTQYAHIAGNNMKYQNDGVALYHCDSITIQNNDFAWNTSYGIRMYFTDHCDIEDNYSPHINRPFTDPSDCAAILLIVSNNNYVVNNDFSYSGDGIFLGQFQYSQVVNNNYFAYNECSYSPHNAIEATFADGNVYEYNNCNYSQYGFWLGYSFNSVVENNEVIGNQHSGIAIDRGFNNLIRYNQINKNPIGLELWEGSAIPPYQNQFSKDYFISNNTIEGNTVAVSLQETEHSVVFNNEFLNNRNTIFISGNAVQDTIVSNDFKNSTMYHIENQSTNDIYALQNNFGVNDESIIDCKIYDANDNASYGHVNWQPYVPGDDPKFQYSYPTDMAEPDAEWYAYPEVCLGYGLHQPTTVEWDYNDKLFGDASVHITTGNGWDIGAMYRPAGDSIASWSLLEQDTLIFWLKSINNTIYHFQFCHVTIGNNCGGYYTYTASAATILNPTIGIWKKIRVPLAGIAPWARTVTGNISFDDINYVEIHADTWDFGFELWIDGVTFSSINTGIEKNENPDNHFSIYPNPVSNTGIFSFKLQNTANVRIQVLDINGKLLHTLVNQKFDRGEYKRTFNVSYYLDGVYILCLSIDGNREFQRFIVSK